FPESALETAAGSWAWALDAAARARAASGGRAIWIPMSSSCKAQRQRAQALLRQYVDGVGHRRGRRRHRRLADSAHLRASLEDVHGHLRHVRRPGDLVVVEVALLDAAVLQRHLAVEDGGEPEG